MNSAGSVVPPRARLFSFVSTKKRWEEEAIKAAQIELDITVPKGRDRQKTVVFYLNSDNGLKLQQLVEQSEGEEAAAQPAQIYKYPTSPTKINELREKMQHIPLGPPGPSHPSPSSAVVHETEEPQGRRRSPIVRQADRHATMEMLERASMAASAAGRAPRINEEPQDSTGESEPQDDAEDEPEVEEDGENDEIEGAKKADTEGEYSSEEEVEEEGHVVVRPSRSKTVQRQQVEMPESKEGWGKKCGVEGYRKKTWQRRYFVLEYPFLDIYDKKGGKRKGRISMRGGILIDEELLDEDKKYKKNVKTSVKISADAKHKLILQFKTDKEKAAWVKALWSNIYYANPAKKPGGISYKVTQVNDEKDDFIINTSMSGITLYLAGQQQPLWFQPFHHLRTIVLPEKGDGENWITFDFSKYGGAKVTHLDNVPPLVLYKSFASLFEACTAWQNTSLLQALYGAK